MNALYYGYKPVTAIPGIYILMILGHWPQLATMALLRTDLNLLSTLLKPSYPLQSNVSVRIIQYDIDIVIPQRHAHNQKIPDTEVYHNNTCTTRIERHQSTPPFLTFPILLTLSPIAKVSNRFTPIISISDAYPDE